MKFTTSFNVTYYVKKSAVKENLGESQPWIVIVKGYLYNRFKGQNLPGHGVLNILSFNPFMTLFQIFKHKESVLNLKATSNEHFKGSIDI